MCYSIWFVSIMFFFFKQKTAYEMRISDWSSDVCSSDLFPLFFTMVLLLFFVSGVGNASTFQMVPGIMRAEIDRTSSAGDPDERRLQADRESAAVIGFISAIAEIGRAHV